jgi:hypothetical protein
MQAMIRTKVSYAFLILAIGLMLTDVCRLAWPPSRAAVADSHVVSHQGKL